MSKKIPALTVLVILLLMILSYFLLIENDEDKRDSLTLYGNVDIRQVNLSFRVPGRIKTMRFEEGDRVKEKEVIAILDQDVYRENLDLAKSQLTEAKARKKNAARTFKRRSNLVKTGAVSQALFDQSLALRDETQAQYQTAIVRLEKAQTSFQDTLLTSPSSGTILTRVQEPGAIVAEGQTVYTLTIDNPVWVRCFVNEPSLGLIYYGQKALIYTDTYPQKPYKGHIGFISPRAEFTPKTVETKQLRTDLVYRLRVVVDNPDHSLKQGMPVTVKIKLQQETSNGS